MHSILERLPKNTVALTVEVPVDELTPFLDRAANELSHHHPVPGFRAGKVPFAVLVKHVAYDHILESALQKVVRATLPDALAKESLKAVGSPRIELLKNAQGNPLVYKATIALLPTVELGDYRTITTKRQPVTIEDADVAKVLNDLRQSRAKEKLILRPADRGHKVEIDFRGTLDRVPLEGATSANHPLILGSGQFIPGFEDALIGMNANESKSFPLRFPEDYHETRLAGKTVDFHVTVKNVYELELPEADDAFAATIGAFKNLEELKEQLRENLNEERQRRERDRLERAILEEIAGMSTIGELPETLIDEECSKMLAELRDGATQRGMEWDKYLESIKKDEGALRTEFRPQAEHRLRLSLTLRAVAEAERIDASDEDVRREIEQAKKLYAGNAEISKNLESTEYRSYMKTMLVNRRVAEFLTGLAKTV